MSVDVVTEITIERPVEVVAAYAADPANAPVWYDNIKSVRAGSGSESGSSVAEGSRFAFVARFLGRELSYTYEVVDYVAGERLTMRTAQGPFPMETTYTWRATAEGATGMSLRNRGQPAGFSRLVAPLMVTAMRRANTKDLRKLKAILEAV